MASEKKLSALQEKAEKAKIADELRTATLKEKLEKEKRFTTTDVKLSNRLQDEGYVAVEAFQLTPISLLINVFNVDADKVKEEECRKCKKLVCICPPQQPFITGSVKGK